MQGHAGVLAECGACHAAVPVDVDGGPHGMHLVGAAWVEAHGEAAEEGQAARCRACHGLDYRGTALSRAFGDRVLDADEFGRKHFWRGFEIGCYTCHLGPDGEEPNPNRAPVVDDGHAETPMRQPVEIPLSGHDADGDALRFRIVRQARHGTVGLTDATARYFPDASFSGSDAFTFTASDGSSDGTLGTVTVTVGGPACAGDCDGDGKVAINELIGAVRIALNLDPLAKCPAIDTSADGTASIAELVQAVNAALDGCPGAARSRP